MKRKKGFFSISAVAKMFSIHQQTIRLYEKEGLLSPKRSAGNTRLFSEEDIDQLEEIIYLTHQLGINLAGVEMILKLKKQIDKMQRDMNLLFEKTQSELSKREDESKDIITASVKHLVELRKKNKQSKSLETHHKNHDTDSDDRAFHDAHLQTDDTPTEDAPWEIDYEDDDL
ncbi:MAG: MerR family transcriptional regulator [Candidatus Babeliales bacterium]